MSLMYNDKENVENQILSLSKENAKNLSDLKLQKGKVL